MNKTLLVISVHVFLLFACTSRPAHNDEAAIREIMDKQSSAWNRGNIEGFMQPYWHSDSLTFIGKRGITYGWDSTLSNYKKSYPTKEIMGRLQFDILRNEITCPDLAHTIGKWTLFRANDTLSGHYTLVWKKMNGEWKIISDHSS